MTHQPQVTCSSEVHRLRILHKDISLASPLHWIETTTGYATSNVPEWSKRVVMYLRHCYKTKHCTKCTYFIWFTVDGSAYSKNTSLLHKRKWKITDFFYQIIKMSKNVTDFTISSGRLTCKNVSRKLPANLHTYTKVGASMFSRFLRNRTFRDVRTYLRTYCLLG